MCDHFFWRTSVFFGATLYSEKKRREYQMRSIKRKLLALMPYNKCVYSAAKRYVDRQNVENDDNMYTNGELWFMRSVLPQCSVAFDVGANVGDWTALALSINPCQKIHCFVQSLCASTLNFNSKDTTSDTRFLTKICYYSILAIFCSTCTRRNCLYIIL